MHALDFWLGRWNVTAGGGPSGSNEIDAILGGCAVAEKEKAVRRGIIAQRECATRADAALEMEQALAIGARIWRHEQVTRLSWRDFGRRTLGNITGLPFAERIFRLRSRGAVHI